MDKKCFSQLHASARYGKLSYDCGEEFATDIYVTSDSCDEREVRVNVQLLDIRGNILCEALWEVKIEDYVTRMGEIKWKTELCEDRVFMLRLKLQSGAYENENIYLYTVDSKNPLEPIRNLPKCEVDLNRIKDGEWVIANNSLKAAVNIFVYGKNPDDFLQISPNYFTLLPNEKKLLHINSEVSLNVKDSSLVVTL